MNTAHRLQAFGTTIFTQISTRANELNAINLGQGFPDADGPDEIIDALAHAAKHHHNQYAPMPGIPQLRHAIANAWLNDTNLHTDPDTNITVTNGATEALAAAALGLFNPGDDVILFEPFYDAYRAALAIAGANPVYVPLHRQHDGTFAFDPNELDAAVTRRTRAVLLNTPHNPTGKVFSITELDAIARLCHTHDLFAITDEVYERLTYDNTPHTHLATRPGMADRTLTISSLGKTFAFTGWKIGWAVGPPALTTALRAAHQFLTFSVNTPAQHAAAHAINAGERLYKPIADDLQTKRDALAQTLRSLGLDFATPQAGYFILAEHTPLSKPLGIDNDIDLVNHLLENTGVAAIPPSAFYHHPELGKPLIRFAFCKSHDTLAEAATRLKALAPA